MSHVSPEREFAFFDLDLTLVPFDTQLLFCNHVMRAEPWRLFYLVPFAPCALLYGLKLIGDSALKRVFLIQLWGMPAERLARHVETFVAQHCPRLFYTEMLAELARHRAEGRITVLNTASPQYYAEPIAAKLGFDHCFATRVTVGERVRWMPRFEGPNNKDAAKIDAMRAILPAGAAGAAGRGGEAAPIAGSYAYSDSSADIPMLELAEHAVMVHPSAKLRRHGERRGWDERLPARPYEGRIGKWWATARQLLGCWEPRAEEAFRARRD